MLLCGKSHCAAPGFNHILIPRPTNRPMRITRRGFLKGTTAAISWAALPAVELGGMAAALAAPAPFAFSQVVDEAARLAAQKFQPYTLAPPAPFNDIGYDQYRDIVFRKDAAIWLNDPSYYHLEFFHSGFIYKEPVQIALVENGQASPLPFSPDYFSYGYGGLTAPANLTGLGFAGLRARAPISQPDVFEEVVAFVGASYFRAVARNIGYGLSARGLAIDTAEPTGEEFPTFRKFWIEKPEAGSVRLVVNALLDSPSLTGAYRFGITSGTETVMDVDATLFPRKDVKRLGLAPLTSMFLFSDMNRARIDDFRRAVHDSDGLQMLSGGGEWIWRPLANPRTLQVSDFIDRSPRGFGLMQRARRYVDYEDAEARYERRPSVWIEPVGDWGQGAVELVEIPSDREANDNIVAYWRPDGKLPPGAPYRFLYRMRWLDDIIPPRELLWVAASRSGLGVDRGKRIFAIDFRKGPDGGTLPDDDNWKITSTASKGALAHTTYYMVPSENTLRVSFEFDPGPEKLSELRVVVVRDGKVVSQTWLYRWTP
jgi:glucans biosynthesis protein